MSSCSVIAIGNELTRGKIIDTNSAFIAAALHDLGAVSTRIVLVEDDETRICAELLAQVERADWIITTGGLGPTADDLTRNAVARAAGTPLEFNSESYAKLEEFCRRRNREVNDNNRRQVYFPAGASILVNQWGTADGFMTPLRRSTGAVVPVFSVPGVPKEMKALVTEQILPWMQQNAADLNAPVISELRVFGLPEAHIGEIIESIKLAEIVEVSYRPQFPEILVQFTVRNDVPSAQTIAQSAADRAAQAMGEQYIISRASSQTLSHIVSGLLTERKLTVAAAESCSGGLFADALVALPGASEFFLGSAVVYSNEAKTRLLGVADSAVKTHGAVSREAALAMAAGARSTLGADLAISITGIAGPDGGTPEKPVGLIWIGFAARELTTAVQLTLPWDRDYNREYSARKALDIIRRYLLGFELK